MKELIGISAALLGFIAYTPYFRDILSKKTNPHPYSWFVWGFTATLIFALQITHGAGAGAYTTATVSVICFTVCIFALKNGGAKDITRTDTIFFCMALTAAGIWMFSNQPLLSMIMLVTAEMLGMAPSIRKAWNKPYGETLSMWNLNGLRHIISIVALQHYSILTIINPLTWGVANLGFGLMLITRRKIIKLSH